MSSVPSVSCECLLCGNKAKCTSYDFDRKFEYTCPVCKHFVITDSALEILNQKDNVKKARFSSETKECFDAGNGESLLFLSKEIHNNIPRVVPVCVKASSLGL